jgi:hypothetical protein
MPIIILMEFHYSLPFLFRLWLFHKLGMLGAGLQLRKGFSPLISHNLWKVYAVPKILYGLEVMPIKKKEMGLYTAHANNYSDGVSLFASIPLSTLVVP